MGPRPVRLNRGPPDRYMDNYVRRRRYSDLEGDNSDNKDNENKANTGMGRSAQQASSPPCSPFHGFANFPAPRGQDVMGPSLAKLQFPPRRLTWVSSQQRPGCPAFPQICKGQGEHDHKGRTRYGARRQTSTAALPLQIHATVENPSLPPSSGRYDSDTEDVLHPPTSTEV